MALLGFHVVVCLIALTLFSKLASRSSFIHFFITSGLYRFVAPSNNELRSLLPPSKEKTNQRNRRKKREEEEIEGFNVPKSSPFQLNLVSVDARELQQFEMYAPLHWLCLCIPISLIVYSLSEIYNYVFPDNKDFNTSIILIIIVVGFVLQVMALLTSYLVSNIDERGFMISIGALYFLFSCIFAMSADRVFDIRMLDAYDRLGSKISQVVEEAAVFTNSTSIQDYRPDNPLLLYISLSIFFSMLSAMLVFPNFRCAIMYLKAIETDGPLARALDHSSFLLPAFILTAFSLPIKNQLLSESRQLLTADQLDILRVYMVIIWMLLRFATRASHLQAHLNLSYDKVAELQNEAGKVRNFSLQSMINRYYAYICCAAIQYFGPVVLALLFALLLKTTAGLSWLGAASSIDTTNATLQQLGPIRFVFDEVICRAFFSFLVTVTLLINFSLHLMGVVYHSYFVHK